MRTRWLFSVLVWKGEGRWLVQEEEEEEEERRKKEKSEYGMTIKWAVLFALGLVMV